MEIRAAIDPKLSQDIGLPDILLLQNHAKRKHRCCKLINFMIQGEIIPSLPPPRFFPEGILRGMGGDIYIYIYIFEAPRGRDFIRAPSFITLPTLEGYFQGGYKILPCI